MTIIESTESNGRNGSERPARPGRVAAGRGYRIQTVAEARRVAGQHLDAVGLAGRVEFGLPEIDDRYHIWRVPLVAPGGPAVGEIVADALTGAIDERRTSRAEAIADRLNGPAEPSQAFRPRRRPISLSPLPNTIALGDTEAILPELPAGSVDLVFTSPPYYNARPDYTEYPGYPDYLAKLRRVIRLCHRALADGRFFVLNVAPVLIRRASRTAASRRLAVPFDLHAILIDEGFEFLDDIIWVKPAGAGWATGRGRRFAADRQPLQYKPVPVTEYVLVYRRATDRLIDRLIRDHPDPEAVRASRIGDDYERTNVWKIKPAHTRRHPAVFPAALAERVIRYYSFRGDVVLDPFAGIGTTGAAAAALGRRFYLIDREPAYVDEIRRQAATWIGSGSGPIACRGCPPVEAGVE